MNWGMDMQSCNWFLTGYLVIVFKIHSLPFFFLSLFFLDGSPQAETVTEASYKSCQGFNQTLTLSL